MSYSNSCGYGNCGNNVSYSPVGSNYSGLETIAYNSGSSDYSNTSYMATEASMMQSQIYENDNFGFDFYSKDYKTKQRNKNITKTHGAIVNDFLNPSRPNNVFVGNAKAIKEFAEDAFEKTTGMPFPDDVIVKVLSKEHFREGLQGFAINRKEQGQLSEVVIKENTLDRVMVILGHELGHVMSKRINDSRTEEAKAFAFSIAWIQAIKKHNIANLSTAVCIDKPAKNGVHDVAHSFVVRNIQQGKKPKDIFKEIITGELRCA